MALTLLNAPSGDLAPETLTVFVDLLAGAGDETNAMTEFEDHLLARLGGALAHPPALATGWAESGCLDDTISTAKELLRGTANPSVLGVGDPRVGMLLPFWRHVHGGRLTTIITIDEPEIASVSLARRLGCSPVHALAIYERYFRNVARAVTGECVYVVATRLGNISEQMCESVVKFLAAEGSPTDAHEPLGDRQHRATSEAEHVRDGLLLPAMSLLHRHFATLEGANRAFAIELPDEESPWTAALLGAVGDLGHVIDGLDWTTRLIEPLVRATPRTPVIVRHEVAGDKPAEEELESTEANEAEPYPLNASEDRRSYHRWLRARRLPVVVGGLDDPPLRRACTRAPRQHNHEPLVSIVVPVWRPPLWALERCLSSVLGQTTGDWELCLCDDASGDTDLQNYLASLRRVDRRIKVCELPENGGISAATNAALAIAKGRFIGFLDHDDELAPNVLAEVERAIAITPDVDVLYSDEDKIDSAGERFDPLFKPDWSPDLLLSFVYICHFTVVRHELVNELGGLRSAFDGSQDYDLSLRATERARCIVHIPEVLYHWRTLPGSAASDSPGAIAKPWAYEAGRRVIEDALARRGESADVQSDENFPGRYHVRRVITSRPLVSVIIPFRDEPALLATCASSLRVDSGYDRVELILVDNGSELPETAALLERLDEDDDVRVVDAPGPFNWAAINNAAVKVARGEMLLFANNDIEASVPRWLDALLGHALRPEVGAVGARLIYPDGAIQHAGVVIGLGGVAGHVLRGLPGTYPGYNSMAIQTRNCSVVTGACMMTRRGIFESVGGFNELLPVAFNDVDYCLKLREQGYLIVYTPLAELIHHESRSRGHTDDLVESRRIVNRWGDAIVVGDPYLSKHLSHWRYWCPLSTAQEDDRWKTYLETSVLTQASSSNI